MARLTPCPSCHAHVLVGDGQCPHCGAALRTTGAPRVATLAVGLSLASCIVAEPAYGLPDPTASSTGSESTAGTATESGTTGSTTGTEATSGPTTEMTTEMATDTADGSGSGSDGTADGSGSGSSGPEPAYGVPGTTSG